MIKTLEIKNFKSIKDLKLDLRRINIFIGEPNTGKSNILETVGIFSFGHYFHYGYKLTDFVRLERTSNLFYDEDLDKEIMISFDNKSLKVWFKEGMFEGRWFKGEWQKREEDIASFSGPHTEVKIQSYPRHRELLPFKFYRFAIKRAFGRPESEHLLPPSGDNLLSLLLTHKELRTTVGQFFTPFGLKLGLRPQENKIELVKQVEDIIISYPYSLASDTLQRLILYFVAIESNKNSVIAFEEPEAHAFPYYIEYLAERIALAENDNQYLVSTHNPYFLLPILEKSPKEEVSIFITYFEDYQTKVKTLSEEEKEEVMELDVFSNIDKFLGRK